MTTSIQEQTERLAKEAVTSLEVILDDAELSKLNRKLLVNALGKMADIIVLNGK